MKYCPKCEVVLANRFEKCNICNNILEQIDKNNISNLKTTIKFNIITCPACQGKVSNQAKSCPHCGQPINTQIICPKCNSTDVESIGGFKKGASALAFGVFSANTVLNNYKCRKCGHKFK